MRKFITYLGLIIVVLFTSCNKSVVYELDYAYNKRLITSEVRDKFVGNWSRAITLQMPDFVFNGKDSINPGVIKFADTIIIRTIKDPLDKNGLAYLDSLNIIYPKYNSIQSGYKGCQTCYKVNIGNAKRLPVEKVIKNLEDHFGLFNYSVLVLERSEGFKIIPEEKWDTLV